MPGIVTHYAFGLELYRDLADQIGTGTHARDAFLLGNQGPDPFFYLVATPFTQGYSKIGSTMHRNATAELLSTFHAHAIEGSTSETLRAYALGFLCHFLLDSTMHPLVYAQQYAICSAGIEGLRGRRAARAAHATIETELDEYVMTTHLHTTVAGLIPHRAALRCAPNDLDDISRMVAKTIYDTYEKPVQPTLFATAVNLFRLAQAMLDSKGAGLRRKVDYLRPTGLASAYVLSLSHENVERPRTSFANSDHIPWPHPYEDDAILSSSFDELFDQAHEKALRAIPAFARSDFGPDDCKRLVGGINFAGKRRANSSNKQ